ncbi:MAG: DUF1049 domain-containing protein [Bacteroidia bacterium]
MSEENKKGHGMLKLVFIVLALVIVVLFALANSENVALNLVLTETKAPLTAIMIVSFLLGLILGLIFLVLSVRKNNKIIKIKNQEISELEKRLGFMNDKLDELEEGRQ